MTVQASAYAAFDAARLRWAEPLTRLQWSKMMGQGWVVAQHDPRRGEQRLRPICSRVADSVAKAKGRLRGKQPKLNRRQEAHLVSLVHNSGEYSTAEVADLLGVGRSTVYRAIERQRIAAKAGLAEATSRR